MIGITGLRRRHRAESAAEARDIAEQPDPLDDRVNTLDAFEEDNPPNGLPAQEHDTRAHSRSTAPDLVTKSLSRWYWRLTVLGALIAIVTTPNPQPFNQLVLEAEEAAQDDLILPHILSTTGFIKVRQPPPPNSSSIPQWLRWIPGLSSPAKHAPPPQPMQPLWKQGSELSAQLLLHGELKIVTQARLIYDWKRVVEAVVDPALLSPLQDTITSKTARKCARSPTNAFLPILTGLIDKILRSRLRLLWIINVFLAGTYLFHQAVADWCLGPERHRLPREQRLGGFLAAKFVLIACILRPDTLDFIILLTWYTGLSVLRSWSSLCAGTTLRAAHAGVHLPPVGAAQLLLGVLLCNCFFIAANVGLFHSVGWSMILLLTADSVFLGIDVVCHLLAHLGQVLEQRHEEAAWRGDYDFPRSTATRTSSRDSEQAGADYVESVHNRRLSIIRSTTFALQLLGHTLKVVHYLHIFMVHGLQFRFLDGVLLVQLNGAVTGWVQKISVQVRSRQLAFDLDSRFPNATEEDIRKATANSDVCCICLSSFATGGSGRRLSHHQVKRVPCGHLYHVSCLQQVLQRAPSIQDAQCPLCRSCLATGNVSGASIARADVGPGMGAARAPPPPPAPFDADGDQADALFRFTTEGIIPAWLPIPGFSFEVVRRPTVEPAEPAERVVAGPIPMWDETADGDEQATLVNTTDVDLQDRDDPNSERGAVALEDPPPPTSTFRRLLILLGIIPMSPAEEAAAMDQLVDMFPQYNQVDLLRELRQRGSPEAVAELALHGRIVPSTA